MTDYDHSVFISYASPDQGRVIAFYEFLEAAKYNPWIDCRKIKPGQNWDFEIKRALEKATFVLFFVSENSYDRRGYLQRELKIALDKVSEKLIDDIYLIPVLLSDDVPLPYQLKGIQYVKASDSAAKEQIVDALNHQLERLGVERAEIQQIEDVTWTSQIIREAWDGIPGYEVELHYLEFRSNKYSSVWQITDFIKGHLLAALFEYRSEKLRPSPELFNYGQETFYRTNTYDAYCGEPIIVGKVMTIRYSVHSHGAGAIHPNQHFDTYSFLLDPVVLIDNLSNLFEDPDSVFPIVQAEARKALSLIEISDGSGGDSWKLNPEWIVHGTDNWDSLSSFVLQKEEIELLFAPYQVASYAEGPQFASIPYKTIAPLMRREVVSALGIAHL